MSVFGIGAYYDDTTDVSPKFLQAKQACIGWSEAKAPTLHCVIKQIKVGDVVFIKSYPPGGAFTVKAVGITRGPAEKEGTGPGRICIPVDWTWTGELELEDIADKYNVRRNTIFEEFNADVIDAVLDALLYKSAVVRSAGQRISDESQAHT